MSKIFVINFDQADNWASLSDENIIFLKGIASKIENKLLIIVAISKLYSTVRQLHLKEGVNWLSKILISNSENSFNINPATVFSIEQLIRKYILKNKAVIKTNSLEKQKVIAILDMLIANESNTAFLLRDSVL